MAYKKKTCKANIGDLCPELTIWEQQMEMAMLDMGIADPQVGDIVARPMTQEEMDAAKADADKAKAKAERKVRVAEQAKKDAQRKADEKKARRLNWMEVLAEQKAQNRAAAERCKELREQKLARAARVKELADEAKRRRALPNPNKGDAARSAMAFMCMHYDRIVDLYKKINADQCELVSLKYTTWHLRQERKRVAAAQVELEKLYDEYGWTHVRPTLKDSIPEISGKIRENGRRMLDLTDELYILKQVAKKAYRDGNGIDRGNISALEEKIRMKSAPKDIIRVAKRVLEKEHVENIAVRSYSSAVVNKEYDTVLAGFENWKPDFVKGEKVLTAESAQALVEAKKKVDEFEALVNANVEKPIVLKRKDGRIVHLPRTSLLINLGIEFDKAEVAGQLAVIEHGFEQRVGGDWRVWGRSREEAEERKLQVIQKMYDRTTVGGVTIGENSFGFLFSSASHQKDEKEVLCEAGYLQAHERVIYYGKTKAEFISQLKIIGPEHLKGLANQSRPIAAVMQTVDGRIIEPKDFLVVEDVKRVYHHDNALMIGGAYPFKDELGQEVVSCWKRGAVDNPVALFDGSIGIFGHKVQLALYGQSSCWGIKGLSFDLSSPIAEVCRKWGLTIEEFYNLTVVLKDGSRHRVGDYVGIMGEGCWKFDKFFGSWNEYLKTLEEMKQDYPHIAEMTILRQLDEEEGEYKIRRLTRSFIQQLIDMSDDEVDRMVTPAAQRLRRQMRFENAYKALARPYGDDPTDLNRLFRVAPFLVTAPNVQAYWQNKWQKLLEEAMANKIRTKGQYPYIIQDPVALIEVWILGMDPNRNDLGVLKAGECSLELVDEGKEVVGVRFPANFLTAKTLTNRCYKDIYESCGNCCVLSIYDDILIVQDGDVDGDEMCILYDAEIVALVKRMRERFNPPVVVFEHAEKNNPKPMADERDFALRISAALFSAAHDSKVGIYANLARDCAYLARISWWEGDIAKMEQFILWMAAASTGAILAIDQVKGNKISLNLVGWLNNLLRTVHQLMNYCQPFTQIYLKGIDPEKALPADMRVHTDYASVRVMEMAGEYAFDSQGVNWNAEAAAEALIEKRWQHFQLNATVMPEEVRSKLRLWYFNELTDSNGGDPDKEFIQALKNGMPVTVTPFLRYLWHNETALSNKCEGRLAEEKRKEFYKVCWWALKVFALASNRKMPNGHIKTDAEILTSLYYTMVNEALELKRNNGVPADKKGSYCMFCLRVVAPAMAAVVQHNGWTVEQFATECYATLSDDDLDDEVDDNIDEPREWTELDEDASVLGENMCFSADDDERFEYTA